ncbi:MAG: PilZ domain-containing protein [Treponema sp.]|nr:PilZ domain-containing protein [Treponema sp.]
MSEEGTAVPPANAINTSGEGKKVFLLYPHSVIREEMLDILIMNGFETYTLFDHKKAIKIFGHFPGSIVFINIDEGMPEKEWEVYIRSLLKEPETKDTKIGILSYNQDKALMGKYLMEIAVPCGYIQLKLGIQESTKIILNALQANEAKGRRKYIRAFCDNDIHASMNFKYEQGICQGQILDISSAGVAVRFPKLPDLPPNSLLREAQLKLHGTLLLTDVILMGKRRDDPNSGIFLFDPTKLKPEHKLQIHHYIKQNLQRYIDKLKI